MQPQAQITWMGVKAKEHKEYSGTNVKGDGQNNISTRLGVRAYLQGYSAMDKGNDRIFQPFVEANWLHNTNNFGVVMDGVRNQIDGARNIGEIKTGVEGQISKNLNLWGSVAHQVGSQGYQDTQASVGVKYLF
ncbi:autotransporter outer membrane beta-barrel domain-containing protein [Citrobacter portucalensis]|uniref:autotransporter outer membrane beta-barrel domain-containing protein n=1 Tax=Citrobacter portucalensis TaxID=1639133 RepID=UPI0039FC8CA3